MAMRNQAPYSHASRRLQFAATSNSDPIILAQYEPGNLSNSWRRPEFPLYNDSGNAGLRNDARIPPTRPDHQERNWPNNSNRFPPGGYSRAELDATAEELYNEPRSNAFDRPHARPSGFYQARQEQPDYHGPYNPMDRLTPMFRPTRMSNMSPFEAHHKSENASYGASDNYLGNASLPANQSANVSDNLNTALWITNLPPTCTHKQLLSAVRNCGKVFATVINPPEQVAVAPSTKYNFRGMPPQPPFRSLLQPFHTTSAAKLVFFDRPGVDELLRQSRMGEFQVGGYIPRLRLNRIRSAPREPSYQCRVLHIEGPSSIVNEEVLHRFFCSKFKYELESVTTLAICGGITRQEWRFGSFRCQAESARQSIAREKDRNDVLNLENHRNTWGRVMVHYGVDPCAP